MSFTVHAGLLLLGLSQSIVISQAGWNNPRLIEPDPKEDVITYWQYQPDIDRANIRLEEEVNHTVCIAILNYEGTDTPTIGPLEENKSNFVLGAELSKDESTGRWLLWITKKQDYETPIMRDYRFTIIAGDTFPTIALNIVNIDDNPPIIQLKERNCAIEENYAGKSNCTYIVSDADGWIDDVKITLSAVPDDAGKKHFDFITTKVTGAREDYELDAYLNVTESLDFETISMYMLLIQAKDGAGNEGNLSAVVRVIDMPDEPPKWTSLTAAEYILEKSTKTFAVSATDGDIQINATINYRIEKENNEGDEVYFEVDQETGVITIKPIDRDTLKKEVFRFLIVAYEVPEPESKINATIIVMVEDINDHIPEILPEVLAISIKEETYTTLEFDPSITIEDPDLAENAQFSVSLVDESNHNWSSAFLVVPTSGYQKGTFTISVINATLLDYEDPNWRNIDIKLQAVEKADPNHVGIRNINIQLINWNDELPIFDPDTALEVSVPEDVPAGKHIATIHATDRDVDDNVTHSLVSQPTFTIDGVSGKIVTNKNDALDYESMPTVVMQVVATDLANHKTYATLTIKVIDVNDVPPQLSLPKQNPELVEEKLNGTEVKALINATDIDTDAEISFSIDWDNSMAHKNSVQVDENLYRGHLDIRTDYPEGHKRNATGTIYITGRIDYEAFDVMFLTISVTDAKTVHNANTTTASLTLNIIDINDNKPIFNPLVPMKVVENQDADAHIATITATDADGPNYNKVSYLIVPTNGTKDDLVSINPLTGVISVKLHQKIDAEEYEYIYYDVTATDGELNTVIPIEIYVIDVNDEIPYLLTNTLNPISIREKSLTGTEIIQIHAKDDDRTCPFNEVSYLMNVDYSAQMQYFSIGRYDGHLVVNLTESYILDRDFGQPEFTLNLMLRDNYVDDSSTWNSHVVGYTVRVILLDINDQKPLLLDREPTSVSETMKKDEFVMTVEADDRDDPATDNTKVFYKIQSIKSIDGNNDLNEDCKDLFVVKVRNQTGKPSAADIYANCDLKGYYGRWALELYAQDLGTDPGPLNDTNTYEVQVTDFNYNDPVIEFPNSNKRIALRAVQTVFAQLRTYDDQLLNDFTASDKDYGESGTVTFSLPNTGDNEYFTIVHIDKNVAQLQLVKPVDLEKQNSYTLSLTATDGGNPPRSVKQDVTVSFVNSLGPKFEDNEWTVWFKENTEGVNTSFVIPEASDMLSGTGENTVDIYYFFMKEDGDAKFFDLNKSTRTLTVVEELDRENKAIMTLIVVAATDKDGPPGNPLKESILNITVVVVDVNDNPPIFEVKPYRGGVAMQDALDKVILTVKATDADINETLTYSAVAGSMKTSDSSISAVSNPFEVIPETGELLLKFTPTSKMGGYFDFVIAVHDAVDHNDTVPVQIYIIMESNRVNFTFNNEASYIKQEKNYVVKCFTNAYKYMPSIDDIKSAVDPNNGQVIDNVSSITTHFISPDNNLPIKRDAIILASSDLPTVSNLKAELLMRSIYLRDIPTGSSPDTNNMQETVHWVLVSLTICFCLSSVILFVVFVIRTKRLKQRLDKLAVTKYGSQESGLDKAGVVPRTNQFAEAGSNPMWKTTEKTVDDNISQGSGDSDLIGIENNPDFGYSNEAFRNDDVWENMRRGSVNPVLAKHEANTRGHYDRNYDASPEEETSYDRKNDIGWKIQ